MGGCNAVLNFGGKHYDCQTACVDAEGRPTVGHDGWAHSNPVGAVWTGNEANPPAGGGD